MPVAAVRFLGCLESTVDPPQIQQKKEKITTTLNNINTINQNWYK
jgi:hypothetical protein